MDVNATVCKRGATLDMAADLNMSCSVEIQEQIMLRLVAGARFWAFT